MVYDDFDAASHTFGLSPPPRFKRVTGDHALRPFGTAQRDWVLGANPWGVSLVIGVGSRSRAARSTSAPTSRRPEHADGGAVVNGPNDRTLFSDGLGEFFDEGRDCHTGGYGAFTGHGSRFVDDVRSWQTVEPAIDFTATAALAFALTG